MTRPLLVPFLVLAVACSGESSGPRHESVEDGVSFARLSGWNLTRERATLVLANPERAATIAVRTSLRDGWSEPRNQSNVFPAVETVLRALPGARVSHPTKLDSLDYPAVAFDVEFTPRGPSGRRYQRRHVALLADAHVIHVFIVAPLGQLKHSRRDFDTIVRSIREEG